MKVKVLARRIALTSLMVALIVSLAANLYFYTNQSGGDLQEQVADLQNQLANLSNQTGILQTENANFTTQLADLEGQAATLSNQTNTLQKENSKLLDEKTSLQIQLNQLSGLKVPAQLVTRLGARDMRYNYSGQNLRLYITGEVWNVGTQAAQNCSLHVTLYQGTYVVVDTYIELGNINGGSYIEVAKNIYYFGSALTKWTIIPQIG